LLPLLNLRGIDYCSTSHMDQCAQYKFIIKYKNNESVEAMKDLFKMDEIILGGGVYEVPCHLQPVFQSIKFDRNDLRNSEKFCPKHICPPITSGTTSDDVSAISASIINHLI